MKKIVGPDRLRDIMRNLKRRGKKIVFTNGCFDIIHSGHIDYLGKAKRMGDVLVVGLNSDRSVRIIKGPHRPINREADRAKVLSALAFVDFVTIFDSATPADLIRMILPDILVKGGDWKGKDIAGADTVKAAGGRIALVSYVKGRSTTAIIEKIKNL